MDCRTTEFSADSSQGGEGAVSNPLTPESEARLYRKKCFDLLNEAIEEDERLMAGPVVYFIAGAGFIKIGTSTNVRSRFCAIKNSSPVPVDLIGYVRGDRWDEARHHKKFRHLRRHGEWFEDTPELREHIQATKEGRAILPPLIELDENGKVIG